MRVVVSVKGQLLTIEDASLALVEDNAGNIVAAAGVVAPRVFAVASIDNPAKLNKILRQLGVDRMAFVESFGRHILPASNLSSLGGIGS